MTMQDDLTFSVPPVDQTWAIRNPGAAKDLVDRNLQVIRALDPSTLTPEQIEGRDRILKRGEERGGLGGALDHPLDPEGKGWMDFAPFLRNIPESRRVKNAWDAIERFEVDRYSKMRTRVERLDPTALSPEQRKRRDRILAEPIPDVGPFTEEDRKLLQHIVDEGVRRDSALAGVGRAIAGTLQMGVDLGAGGVAVKAGKAALGLGSRVAAAATAATTARTAASLRGAASAAAGAMGRGLGAGAANLLGQEAISQVGAALTGGEGAIRTASREAALYASMNVTEHEYGDLRATLDATEQDVSNGKLKAAISRWLEVSAELSGGVFAERLGPLFKKWSRLDDAGRRSVTNAWITGRAIQDGAPVSRIRKVLETAGIQSVPVEMGEEAYGAALNDLMAALTGGELADPGALAALADIETLVNMAVANIAVSGGGSAAALAAERGMRAATEKPSERAARKAEAKAKAEKGPDETAIAAPAQGMYDIAEHVPEWYMHKEFPAGVMEFDPGEPADAKPPSIGPLVEEDADEEDVGVAVASAVQGLADHWQAKVRVVPREELVEDEEAYSIMESFGRFLSGARVVVVETDAPIEGAELGGGVVVLNKKELDRLAQDGDFRALDVLSHELAHDLERRNKDLYQELQAVVEANPELAKQAQEFISKKFGEQWAKMLPGEQASEITSAFSEPLGAYLFTMASPKGRPLVDALLKRDRSLAQRVVDSVVDALSRVFTLTPLQKRRFKKLQAEMRGLLGGEDASLETLELAAQVHDIFRRLREETSRVKPRPEGAYKPKPKGKPRPKPKTRKAEHEEWADAAQAEARELTAAAKERAKAPRSRKQRPKVEAGDRAEWKGEPVEVLQTTGSGARQRAKVRLGSGEVRRVNLGELKLTGKRAAEPEVQRRRERARKERETGRGPRFSPAPPRGSAEFKRWFGDSKVVDEKGEPLVVYHGTRQRRPFTVFRTRGFSAHFGIAEAANLRLIDRRLSDLATREDRRREIEANRVKKFEQVYPLLLSIQNPLRAGQDPMTWDDPARVLYALMEGADDPSLREELELMLEYAEEQKLDYTSRGYDLDEWRESEEADEVVEGTKAELIALGFDGIVYENEVEGGESWVAFRPEQIKSATGNRGTFDPNDPDIKHSPADIPHHKRVTERIPSLQEAAAKIKEGTGPSQSDYQKLINKYKPVLPYEKVPAPATKSQMKVALGKKADGIGGTASIESGHIVGLRLDIPAYRNHGVWVPTIHEGKGSPKVIGYESTAAVTSATFAMSEAKALGIAAGGKKSPFAVIKGEWLPMSADEAVALAEKALSDPAWAQVGMDPERHSFFYDRKTQQPILSADRVVQIGPLVLAENPVYGSASSYKFSPGGFYSAIERAVESSPQKKFAADQLRALLRPGKMPGVTQQELDWLDIEAFLRGPGPFTKENALKWIRAHDPKVTSLIYEGPAFEGLTDDDVHVWDPRHTHFAHESAQEVAEEETQQLRDEARDKAFDEAKDAYMARFAGQLELIPGSIEEEAERVAERAGEAAAEDVEEVDPDDLLERDPEFYEQEAQVDVSVRNQTEHWSATWHESGGDLYLYHTDTGETVDWGQIDPGSGVERSIRETLSAYYEMRRDTGEESLQGGGRYSEHIHQSTSAYRELLIETEQEEYEGDHFEEHEQLVAHALLDDLRVPESDTFRKGKALFAHEIQSDRHQKGREFGYTKPRRDLDDVFDIREVVVASASEWREKTPWGVTPDRAFPSSYWEAVNREGGAVHQAITRSELEDSLWEDLLNPPPDATRADATRAVSPLAVPDSPFKKAWPSLVIKHMLMKAVEEGYDYIAWAAGDVVADRWQHREAMRNFYDKEVVDAAKALGKRFGTKPELRKGLTPTTDGRFSGDNAWVMPITSKMEQSIETVGFTTWAPRMSPAMVLGVTAATKSRELPGLRALTRLAGRGNEAAATTLQDITRDYLAALLDLIPGVEVTYERQMGVYAGEAEPSMSVRVEYQTDSQRRLVASRLGRFARNLGQYEVHSRAMAPPEAEPGDVYPDGSFATPVYTYKLGAEPGGDDELYDLARQAGLAGASVAGSNVTIYYAGDPSNEQAVQDFIEAAYRYRESLGERVTGVEETVERLWAYGDEEGQVRFPEFRDDIEAGAASSVVARRLAAIHYHGLNGPAQPDRVRAFQPERRITDRQRALQQEIAAVFEELPINDLGHTATKKAYQALAREVRRQYQLLPVRIEAISSATDLYPNSKAMRKDVADNNRLKVFATEPHSFGPPGVDYTGHPMLEDSGLTDATGRPMLYNDLLRAVHDYYAHIMTPAQFGPLGEEAAWKNHMAMTRDPWARWALTTETRGQNSWVNFNWRVSESDKLSDRPFAEQKVALMPIAYSMTGDAEVDAEMQALADSLSEQGRQGSFRGVDRGRFKANEVGREVTESDIEQSLKEGKPRFSPGPGPRAARGTRARRSKGSIVEAFGLPPVTGLDKLRRLMSDEHIQVRRLMESLRRSTDLDLTNLDLEDLVRKYGAKSGHRIKVLDDMIVAPLARKLRRHKIDRAKFDDYLMALHRDEALAALAEREGAKVDIGMSKEEADAALKYGNEPGVKDAAALVRKLNDTVRDGLLADGLISSETHKQWSEMYPNYVPLRTDDPTEPLFALSGTGFHQTKPVTHTRMGRSDKASSPLVFSLVQAQNAIIRGETNRVSSALYRLVKKHSALGNTDETTEEASQHDSLEHEVRTWIKGVEHSVYLRDVDLARSLKRMYPTDLHWAVKALRWVNRQLAMLLTSRNPTFFLPNLARDLQAALIHLGEFETGRLPTVTAAAAYYVPSSIRQGYRWAKGDYGALTETTTTDKHGATTTIRTRKGGSVHWAERFSAAGGTTSWAGALDFDAADRDLRARVESGNAKRIATALVDVLDNVNTSFELGTRIAVFRALVEHGGMTDSQAASVARGITVDFNRRGEIATSMGALYLFANASIQGTMRLLGGLTNRRVLTRAAGVASVGFMLDMWNAAVSGEDDDGRSFYDNAPDYTKQSNLMVYHPDGSGRAITIPLPYGHNVFHNMGRMGGAFYRGAATIGDVTSQVMGSTIDAFAPVQGTTLIHAAVPTALRPWYEVEINKNFAGFPINPETYPGDTRPDSYRYRSSTSAEAKAVAQFINRLTGGDEAEAGFIDFSPGSLEHVMSSYTGGIGKMGVRLARVYNSLVTGTPVETQDIPVARRFFRTPTKHGVRENYYAIRDELAVVRRRVKLAEERRDGEAIKLLRRRHAPLLSIERALKASEKKIKDLRGRRDVEQDPKKRVQLEDQIHSVQARLVKTFDDRVPAPPGE